MRLLFFLPLASASVFRLKDLFESVKDFASESASAEPSSEDKDRVIEAALYHIRGNGPELDSFVSFLNAICGPQIAKCHIDELAWETAARLINERTTTAQQPVPEPARLEPTTIAPTIDVETTTGDTMEPSLRQEAREVQVPSRSGLKRSRSENRVEELSRNPTNSRVSRSQVIEALDRIKRNRREPEDRVGLHYMDYHHFLMAKRGDYAQLMRNIEILDNAYSNHIPQLFSSAYKRLLDDSYEMSRSHLDRYRTQFQNIGGYSLRPKTKSKILAKLKEYMEDGTIEDATARDKSAKLEAELVQLAKDSNWAQLQYELDVLQTSRVGRSKMKSLFRNVYSMLKD